MENKNNGKFIACGVIAVIFIAVIALMAANTNDKLPSIEKNSSGIVIGGTYGVSIDKNEIIEITLTEDIPFDFTKINGLGIGKKLEGLFKDSNNNEFRQYVVNKGNAPYILIKSKIGNIYINDDSKNSTEELYDKLK